MGYAFASHFMRGRFSFTFLRDPSERILSMYYFCKSRNPDQFEIYRQAREMNLHDFLQAALTDPYIRMHIWNNQVWQLAHGYTSLDNKRIDDFSKSELLSLAKEHLEKFSYVGFTETFDTDAAAILKSLRFPKDMALVKQNETPNKPCLTKLPTEVQALLLELTELDRVLYDYARERFSAVSDKSKRKGWWW